MLPSVKDVRSPGGAPAAGPPQRRTVTIPVKLHQLLYADLLLTVHYVYDPARGVATSPTVVVEHEGWGLRGLSYQDPRDVYIVVQGPRIEFQVDFSLIIGPASVSKEGFDIPLPSITRLHTVRGQLEAATGKGSAFVYPRGW